MSNVYGVYDLNIVKEDSEDIVSPWINNLLIERDSPAVIAAAVPEITERASVLAYPVERVLSVPEVPEIFTLEEEPGLKLVEKPSEHVFPVIKADPEAESAYFSFKSDNSLFAVDVKNIVEIIKYRELTNMFSKKPELMGVMPYRSVIIPVYNSSRLFATAMDVKNIFKYIIVFLYENKRFGIAVNEIEKITMVKNKNIISSASFRFWSSNGITQDVFEGEGGKFFSVVDIKNLFEYLKS